MDNLMATIVGFGIFYGVYYVLRFSYLGIRKLFEKKKASEKPENKPEDK